ncbi:hypothetical protein CCAX7_004650 [Capsulimonas corticalis]|uniref:DinB-like domain-containing protein n=1 Tax=Capsulimonas corticalis TaxID=2219043 RepID=A0A402D2S3_9BACT|nr:DinB family protein [Capsulimonas corticalis]BDI28414.1 hypothetical protein CCAX7_004650 [Capsulimonas corticalis]
MPTTIQNFLAEFTPKAAENLIAALLRLPEDKRLWAPSPTARPALSLVAECALNNSYTVDMIETRQWTAGTMEEYFQEQTDLMNGDWATLEALLRKNTERFTACVRDLPDDVLGDEITMPFGKFTMTHTISYPYWNMSYHEGQINYIASILDRLNEA